MKIAYIKNLDCYRIDLEPQDNRTFINGNNIMEVEENFIAHMKALFDRAVDEKFKE